MGLSALIEKESLNIPEPDKGKWRQFILDHLDYIAVRSKTYEIDALVVNLYRYDLKHFLRDNLKRRQDMGWIVLLLNDLHNDFEFNEACSLVIPTDQLISNLYHSFYTILRNQS